MRQARVAVGERKTGRGQAALLATARYDVGPVQAGSEVAPVSAAVHHYRAADAAGNARQKLQSGEAGGSGMLGHCDIERGGAGDDAIRLDRDRTKTTREPD